MEGAKIFFSKTIFFLNMVPCSKMKAHDFVFPQLFILSEILVVSTTWDSFVNP